MADESTLRYLAQFLPRTALKAATNFPSGLESLATIPTQLANYGLSYLTGREPIPGSVTPSDYLPKDSLGAQMLASRGIDINQPQRLAPFETPEQKRQAYQAPIKPIAEKILGPKAFESQNRTERFIDRLAPVALEAMTFGVPLTASLVGHTLGQATQEAGFGPLADLIATVGGSLGYSAIKSPQRVKKFAEEEATRLYNQSKEVAGDSRVNAPELYEKIGAIEKKLPSDLTIKLAQQAEPELRDLQSKFINGDVKISDLVDAKQKLGQILSGRIREPEILVNKVYRPLYLDLRDYLHNIPGNPEFSQVYKSADNLYQGIKQSGALQNILNEKISKNLNPATKYLFGGLGLGGSNKAFKAAFNYPGATAAGTIGLYGLKKADDVISLMNRISKIPAIKDSMSKLGNILLKEDIPAATHALKNLDKVISKEARVQAKEIKQRNKDFTLVRKGSQKSIPQHEGFTLVKRGGQNITQ